MHRKSLIILLTLLCLGTAFAEDVTPDLKKSEYYWRGYDDAKTELEEANQALRKRYEQQQAEIFEFKKDTHVRVYGAVKVPGVYPARSVGQVMKDAGGQMRNAASTIIVTRESPEGKTLVQIKYREQAGRDFLLRPGDIIYVSETIF